MGMLHIPVFVKRAKTVKKLWIFLKKPLTFQAELLYNNQAPVKGRTAMMREIARDAR